MLRPTLIVPGVCNVKGRICVERTAKRMASQQMLGEATISGRGVVNLPARALRTAGWKSGDRHFVELLGVDMLVFGRRPEDIAEAFAGRLTSPVPRSGGYAALSG